MIYIFTLIITLSILDIIYSALTINKIQFRKTFISVVLAYPVGLMSLQAYFMSKLFEKNILMLSGWGKLSINLLNINIMIFILGWLICAGVIGILSFLNNINKKQMKVI